MERLQLRKMLEAFYLEDIGSGDCTSEVIFDGQHGRAIIHSKSNGIFAGGQIITEGFRLLDPDIQVELRKQDGEGVSRGEYIASMEGPVAALLTGERVILNLIQRMSGIATMTAHAVGSLNDPSIRICDTRKTTPGIRMLEKYAVRAGGGFNHRQGLYDGIMIKDNHIAACGSITKAVERARSAAGHMMNIEVEIETEEQLHEAIAASPDIIMFDNCSPDSVRRFAALTPEHIVTEASGGITMDTLPAYRGTGVHYISLGFLTHSVQSLDISMDITDSEEE